LHKSDLLTNPIQSNMSVHHHRCLALCFVNICQKGRFRAASLAPGSSMPNEDRSLQTFQIKEEHVHPGDLLQLSSSCTNIIQLMSANSFIQAKRPNRESQRDLTAEKSEGCWVIRHTASFLTKSCQWMSKKTQLMQWIYSLYICHKSKTRTLAP